MNSLIFRFHSLFGNRETEPKTERTPGDMLMAFIGLSARLMKNFAKKKAKTALKSKRKAATGKSKAKRVAPKTRKTKPKPKPKAKKSTSKAGKKKAVKKSVKKKVVKKAAKKKVVKKKVVKKAATKKVVKKKTAKKKTAARRSTVKKSATKAATKKKKTTRTGKKTKSQKKPTSAKRRKPRIYSNRSTLSSFVIGDEVIFKSVRNWYDARNLIEMRGTVISIGCDPENNVNYIEVQFEVKSIPGKITKQIRRFAVK